MAHRLRHLYSGKYRLSEEAGQEGVVAGFGEAGGGRIGRFWPRGGGAVGAGGWSELAGRRRWREGGPSPLSTHHFRLFSLVPLSLLVIIARR